MLLGLRKDAPQRAGPCTYPAEAGEPGRGGPVGRWSRFDAPDQSDELNGVIFKGRMGETLRCGRRCWVRAESSSELNTTGQCGRQCSSKACKDARRSQSAGLGARYAAENAACKSRSRRLVVGIRQF